MSLFRSSVVLFLLAGSLSAATIGTVFPVIGGASDLDLDEARGRIYLVRPAPYSQVDVYSLSQRRVIASVKTDTNPLTAAFSWDKRYLYVACNDAAVLDIIDLDAASAPALVRKVTLPAKPEAVAVGNDGRVLITTQGSGANSALNTLLLFDPNATGSPAIGTITTVPPAATPPQLPPPAGRTFLALRGQLAATLKGDLIIGLNAPNTTTRAVFIYDVASATVLRSRSVGDISNVFSVSPDGSRFMAGLTLFETSTLTVLAQQNAANAGFLFSTTETTAGYTAVASQFRLQTNQGGSVFAPDGSALYSAFDIAPVQATSPARANVTQFLLNDPDNLLIRNAYQLPENLAGKMEISADGKNVYALSESGFVSIPLGTVNQLPVAALDSTALLLISDPCNVSGGQRQSATVRNTGAGHLTVQSSLVSGTAATAPAVSVQSTTTGAQISFTFNSANAKANGTVAAHDYLISASEAINLPPIIRVHQNTRDSEARGGILPLAVNASPDEGLVDMAMDSQRQRLYIANSGLNQVEVFDLKAGQFLTPIKVGQLPRSVALAPSGSSLYVANSGSEYISVVDLDQNVEVSRLRMPPIPFNATYAIITPRIVATTERGLMVILSSGTTGTLWSMVGNDLVPRNTSSVIGATALTSPWTMASTPAGEYLVLLAGNGYVYLYDASVDDFVQGRQLFTTPIIGLYGPISAGPKGAYYVVNNLLLNSSLTPINTATSSASAGGASIPLLVSGLQATAAGQYARYVQPLAGSGTALTTASPTIETVDASSGTARSTATALEGQVAASTTATTRLNVPGRTLAIDPSGANAYAISLTGLSVIPLDTPSQTARPAITSVVNLASRQAAVTANNSIVVLGRNLGQDATADAAPYPTTLGSVCVTLNGSPIPLLATSAGQLNAHIPSTLATGRYPLVVHALDTRLASSSASLTIVKYAPAVLVDLTSGQAAIYHGGDGTPVTRDKPADRDEALVLYATGLGAVTGGRVGNGDVTPGSPDLTPDAVSVFFDNPSIKESAIIVESSRLVPGLVGVYEVHLRVPGTRRRGDALLVTVRVGGVSSPQSGPVVPYVAVE